MNQSTHILITLPTSLVKKIDKRRKNYYDLKYSEYFKNLALRDLAIKDLKK